MCKLRWSTPEPLAAVALVLVLVVSTVALAATAAALQRRPLAAAA